MSNVPETNNDVDALMDAFMGRNNADSSFTYENEAEPQEVETQPEVQETDEMQSYDGSQVSVEEQVAMLEKRRRDFQSMYDKTKSELEQLKQSQPFMEAIMGDPDKAVRFYDFVRQELSRDGSAQQEAESKIAPPEKPQRPERPRDYDPYDTDPSSASYKFREADEEYRMRLDEYYEAKREYDISMATRKIEQSFQPYIQTIEQQKQVEQQNQQIRQIYSQFVDSGIDPNEAAGAVQWASTYQVTPQDIAMLYRMKNGSQAQAPMQGQPATQQVRQRMEFPVPASTVGNSSTPKPKVEEQFFDMMLGMDKKVTPF